MNEENGIKLIKELVKDLIELVVLNNLVELECDWGGQRIRICRQGSTIPAPEEEQITKAEAKETPTETTEPTKKYEEIKSPMVGVFYGRSRPDAPPFVEKGDVVEPEQPLCIIEAMKLMNEILAEKKGKIIEIKVKDGDTVDRDQILFLIEPID